MQVSINDLKSKSPLKNLQDMSLEALSVVATTSLYSKGDMLFKAGDREQMAAFLINGSVNLESVDGRIISIDQNHGMSEFALSNLKPRMYTATAASDDTIIFWVKDEALDIMISESQNSQGIIVTDVLPTSLSKASNL